MQRDRYEVRAVTGRTDTLRWLVWDTTARKVATVDGSRCAGLTRWEARQVTGSLNHPVNRGDHAA